MNNKITNSIKNKDFSFTDKTINARMMEKLSVGLDIKKVEITQKLSDKINK